MKKKGLNGNKIASESGFEKRGVANGYARRLVDHGNKEALPIGNPHQLIGRIPVISQAQADDQRGIRRERLPLYLGEQVWRYNQGKMNFDEQEKLLMTLRYQNSRSE